MHYNIRLRTFVESFVCGNQTHSISIHTRLRVYTALNNLTLLTLGVRSLTNASRARQFNPLNPPGVGWVNLFYFFKVRVSIRTCVPNLGAVRRERFLTIYNPLNPPGVGWVKIVIFFKVRVSIRTCVPNLGAIRRESF